MVVTFGHSVQDYYLEQVRRNQAERKARLAALKTAEDARELVAETRVKVRACFRFHGSSACCNFVGWAVGFQPDLRNAVSNKTHP